MERVRLDMGALSVSDFHGGNFVFFLYKKGGDSCLPIKLSRPDVNIILTNFKSKETSTSDELPTAQMLYCTTLKAFGIELLELSIIKGIGHNKNFMTELLLFDGKKESRLVCGFGNGIVIAKFLNAPIYVYSDIMDKYASKVNMNDKSFLSGGIPIGEMMKGSIQSAERGKSADGEQFADGDKSGRGEKKNYRDKNYIEKLREELRKAVDNEDYERAEILNEEIKTLTEKLSVKKTSRVKASKKVSSEKASRKASSEKLSKKASSEKLSKKASSEKVSKEVSSEKISKGVSSEKASKKTVSGKPSKRISLGKSSGKKNK
jgi:bifunctional DNase/RNase